MRPAFLLCARNKKPYLRDTARRLLEQTYEPLQIVFSDHWSDDGSWELLQDIAESYSGPHEIKLLRCPDVDRRGILGLNAHMDWAVRRIDADVIFFASADDIQYPTRVEKTMEVWEANPQYDYIATRVRYLNPDGAVHPIHMGVQGSGQVDLKTDITLQIGFKTGGAWKRDLWLRHGPMRGIEAPDLILPALAAIEGGLYYFDEILHDSVHVADPDGVSIERAMQSAKDTDQYLPLIEVNQYQLTSSHFALMHRLTEMKVQLDAATATALTGKIVRCADHWVQWRDRLTMERVTPAAMNA